MTPPLSGCRTMLPTPQLHTVTNCHLERDQQTKSATASATATRSGSDLMCGHPRRRPFPGVRRKVREELEYDGIEYAALPVNYGLFTLPTSFARLRCRNSAGDAFVPVHLRADCLQSDAVGRPATLVTNGDPAQLGVTDITKDSMRTAFAAYARDHEAAIRRCWSTWNVLCTFRVSGRRVTQPVRAGQKTILITRRSGR
jgi:hypothetical protein